MLMIGWSWSQLMPHNFGAASQISGIGALLSVTSDGEGSCIVENLPQSACMYGLRLSLKRTSDTLCKRYT